MHSFKIQVFKKTGNFLLDIFIQQQADILGLYGVSGSGKTTLLNCVAGFQQPDSGKIEIDNQVFFDASKNTNMLIEKRRLGYVSQFSTLFPNMSVNKNISFGFDHTPKNERIYSPADIISFLGIGHLIDRHINGLSGGEKQLVSLARAIASSPKGLLLDEPLSSLDSRSKIGLIQKIRLIKTELNIPILYVSHSPSEIMFLCDQVSVISKGNIINSGKSSIIFNYDDLNNIDIENFFECEVIDSSNLKLAHQKIFISNKIFDTQNKIPISLNSSDIIVSTNNPAGISAQNVFYGKLIDYFVSGNSVLILSDIGEEIWSKITLDSFNRLKLSKGSDIYLIIKTSNINFQN
tara:strand:- start:4824 stop:5870 length:1047 start_codon:yes stop_codon:yes gene_type:complete